MIRSILPEAAVSFLKTLSRRIIFTTPRQLTISLCPQCRTGRCSRSKLTAIILMDLDPLPQSMQHSTLTQEVSLELSSQVAPLTTYRCPILLEASLSPCQQASFLLSAPTGSPFKLTSTSTRLANGPGVIGQLPLIRRLFGRIQVAGSQHPA